MAYNQNSIQLEDCFMKAHLLLFFVVAALTLVFSSALASDQDKCAMCHSQSTETLPAGHQKCAACHTGVEEHLDDPMGKVPSAPTEEKCQACHTPTDEFKADAHHNMGMSCDGCHTIHDD
jgi:hypothetical protein